MDVATCLFIDHALEAQMMVQFSLLLQCIITFCTPSARVYRIA